MARSLFASTAVIGPPRATVYILNGSVPANYGRPNVTLPVADIETTLGAPIPWGQMQLTGEGKLPRFLGPDGVTGLTVLLPDGVSTVAITGITDAEATDHAGAFAPLPSGTPTAGQVPIVTTASPLALGWGSGGSGGGASLSVTPVKSANYTAAAGEFVRFDTTAAPRVLTLPTAPADGTQVGAKIVTLGTGNGVTVNCGGSDVVNKAGGVTTFALSLLGQAVLLQYKASDSTWTVLEDDLPLSQLDTRYQSSPTLSGTLKIKTETSGAVTPIIELDGFGRHYQGPMIDTSNAGGGRDLVLLDCFNFRRVDDLVLTNGSTAVTSALEARFGVLDNGKAITGAGIPAGTTLVWVAGTDSATAARLSQAATASGATTATIGTNDGASLTDFIYWNEGGGQGGALGIGYTPPPTSYRLAVAGDDSVPGQGELLLRVGPSQTADTFTVKDSGGTVLATMDFAGRWSAPASKGDVLLWDSTVANSWKIQPGAGGAGTLRFRQNTSSITALDFASDGSTTFYKNMALQGSLTLSDAKNIILGTTTGTKIGSATTQKLGFWNAAPVVQQARPTDLAGVIALLALLGLSA